MNRKKTVCRFSSRKTQLFNLYRLWIRTTFQNLEILQKRQKENRPTKFVGLFI